MTAPAGWRWRWVWLVGAGAALIMLCAIFASMWFVETIGEAAILSQERTTITDELELLTMIDAEEGGESLVRSVARRAAVEQTDRLYLLVSGRSSVIAGNLEAWPDALALSREPVRVRLQNGAVGLVAARSLPGGRLLLVGRDAESLDLLHMRLFQGVRLALIAVVALSAGLAYLALRLVMRRVELLSAAARRVSAGDLSARAELAPESSPFGDIARAQNAMLDEIERLVLGLRAVTDSLAHDLRTPLARARRVLEQGIAQDDPQARLVALEAGARAIDRVTGVFNALIEIARAEGGLSRDAMSEVDLRALAEDVYDLFEPLAEDHQLTFTLALPQGEARAFGHRPLLMQATSNLVHNALKYTPAGGTVQLTLGAEPEWAEITVADNGPGIPADRREAAVRRFGRVTPRPRTDDDDASASLGLGLAIVDACARLHGGRLTLEDHYPGLKATLRLARAPTAAR